jgi:hypothetical protein
MHCNTCNTTAAARIKIGYDKTGNKYEICDLCSNVAPVWLPDVYLEGNGGIQTNENLCNPKTGEPIPYSTKREKAAIMKMLKVREADSAGHQHGARNESHLHRKTYFI